MVNLLNIDRSKQYQLVTIGNAIVDVQSFIDDSLLKATHLPKGSMNLIDSDQVKHLKATLPQQETHSGGSASNTAMGFSFMGGKAGFIGRVAKDDFGEIFMRDMHKNGITVSLSYDAILPTSSSNVMVTPDGERTMATHLAAASNLSEDTMMEEEAQNLLKNTAILYFEGYLYDTAIQQKAIETATRIAKENGAFIALSLSDSFCVERHRVKFMEFIKNHCDIVFCNNDEAEALIGSCDRTVVQNAFQNMCALSTITLGEKGALSISKDHVIEVETQKIETPKDTTGAGDQYAAGFLYGLVYYDDLHTITHIANLMAQEVVTHYGARPEKLLLELKQYIK